MYFRSILATLFVAFTFQFVSAQVFFPPVEGFSRQKTSYIVMEDGTEVAGTIERIKRKKGLIASIVFTDSVSGKEMTYTPDQVKSMRLRPSGLDNFSRGTDFLNDATKWSDADRAAYKTASQYAYFEKTEVVIKGKVQVMMLQLVNPTFADKVRFYHDPYAAETTQVSVGGIGVAGGDDKSYYLKRGDKPAYKFQKKNFDDEFATLFGDCASVKKEYGDKPKWSKLEDIVFAHWKCN